MPGGGRQPGAGRPKGARDKRTEEFKQEFDDACKRHNVDFIEGLVVLCKHQNEDIRLRAYNMALPYLYPKLRHVEITPNMPTEPVFQLIVEKEKKDE